MLGFLLLSRTFVDAWAVWVLWNWFVAPLGVARLGYWHAIGLDLFVGLLFLFAVTRVEEDEEKEQLLILAKLVAAPMYVGVGWLALQGMEHWS